MNIIETDSGTTVHIWASIGSGASRRSMAVACIYVPPEYASDPPSLLRWVADELERPVLSRYSPTP
jgi:hypothetical protein